MNEPISRSSHHRGRSLGSAQPTSAARSRGTVSTRAGDRDWLTSAAGQGDRAAAPTRAAPRRSSRARSGSRSAAVASLNSRFGCLSATVWGTIVARARAPPQNIKVWAVASGWHPVGRGASAGCACGVGGGRVHRLQRRAPRRERNSAPRCRWCACGTDGPMLCRRSRARASRPGARPRRESDLRKPKYSECATISDALGY